ncbi:MAG: hypothetical protein EOP68_25010, partial [Sphingomonas sp.]
PVILILTQGETLMRLAGQDPEVARRAGRFMTIIAFALLPGVLAGVMRTAAAALGRPGWAFLVTGLSLLVGIAGNWLLVFGNLGFPALGLEGSALASVASLGVMMIAYGVILTTDRRLRRFHLFGRWWRTEWSRFHEIVRLGTPIMLTWIFEGALFGGAARDLRVLPGEPHQRFALREDQDDGERAEDAEPQRHPHAAPDLAHGMRAAAEFGGDQRRRRAGQPDQREHQQVEDEHAERRGGKIDRAEPRDEDHVDRGHRHLDQVRPDQRRGEPQQRAKLGAGIGGRRAGGDGNGFDHPAAPSGICGVGHLGSVRGVCGGLAAQCRGRLGDDRG